MLANPETPIKCWHSPCRLDPQAGAERDQGGFAFTKPIRILEVDDLGMVNHGPDDHPMRIATTNTTLLSYSHDFHGEYCL